MTITVKQSCDLCAKKRTLGFNNNETWEDYKLTLSLGGWKHLESTGKDICRECVSHEKHVLI